MNSTDSEYAEPAIKKLNLFWALSRTPHALIDMSSPALAAILCLGHFPSIWIIFVGGITAFAGYTAVYALNDLVDYRPDCAKVKVGGYDDEENYLDGVLIRHPLAKGVLSFKAGVVWTLSWASIAMLGAWILNPVCLYIFIAGCILEAVYCLLWSVTHMRVIATGIVKTCGALAAVYAVNPSPPVFFVVTLFLWIFFWEIGGQNIPADWTDIEEDKEFDARTIPLTLGGKKAGLLGIYTLITAMIMNIAVFYSSPIYFGPYYLLIVLGINFILLLWPAFCLFETSDREAGKSLFNKASYYPLAMLILVIVKLIFQ